MNKLFKSIVAASVGIAMAIGVGVGASREANAVYADDVTFAPSDFSGQGTSGSGSAISATVGGVTFACDKGYGTTQVRCYSGGTITISTSGTISAIAFSWSGSYTGGLVSSYNGLSTNSWSNTLSSQLRMTGCTVTYSVGGAQTYKVTYNPNGATSGTVPVDSNSYDDDNNTVTVLGNSGELAKLGYLWGGWNTKADGTGTTYSENGSFSIAENTTLYAKWDVDPSIGVITFGSGNGSTSINSTSVAGEDTGGKTWTINTVMSETSFTQNAQYSQVGSSNKPATSISFSAPLGETFSVTSFSIKLGGFSGTAGDVALKVGDATVATGSLSADNDVVVSSSSPVVGSSLSIEIENIAKGVKVYYIRYSLDSNINIDFVSITGLPASGSVDVNDTLDLGSTISVTANGNYSSNVSWESDDENVATVDGLGVVTGVAEGTTNIVVTADDDPNVSMTCAVTVNVPFDGVILELDYEAMTKGGITTTAGSQRFEKNAFVITITNGVANENNKDVRVYANASITFTAPANILSIAFTCTTSKPVTNFDDAEGLDKTNGIWTGSASSVTFTAGQQVQITNLVITYEKPSASAEIESINTYSKLSYNYQKNGDGVVDTLDKSLLNISGTSYVDWNNITSNSGIAYSGNSLGNANFIQLKSNDDISGIVVTSNNTSKTVTKITVQWNTRTADSAVLDVYGRTSEEDAYDGASDLYGSDVAFDSLTYDGEQRVQELVVSDNYQFIGLRSNSGVLYIDSISIQWGTVSFTYDDVAIRLGGKVDKVAWNELNGTTNNIQSYGVLLSNKTYLGNTELKTLYGSANSDNFKTFDMELTIKAPVDDGDYYYWNLYKRVTEHLTEDYVAVAYIRTKTGVVFLQQVTASAKSLANDMINDPLHDVGSFEGSLANLACK